MYRNPASKPAGCINHTFSQQTQKYNPIVDNVRPLSTAHAQRWINFGSTSRVRIGNIPRNRMRSPNVVLMLGHRLLRWPNIYTTLDRHLVFVGKEWLLIYCRWFGCRILFFCKAKRQYLLTFKVSRYCLLALEQYTAIMHDWLWACFMCMQHARHWLSIKNTETQHVITV